jgi:hypothetical protein
METVQLVATFLLPETEKLRKLEEYIGVFQEEWRFIFLSRPIHAEATFNLVRVFHQYILPEFKQVLMDGFEIKFVTDPMSAEELMNWETKIRKELFRRIKLRLSSKAISVVKDTVTVDWM